jgi:Flp pilus assembly protein RcpC/CpaB
MPLRPPAGLDLATGALLLGGAGLVAASIVAAVVLLAPRATPASLETEPTPTAISLSRPAAALAPDRVGTVLSIDANGGASSAVRPGDHVDVLSFFPQQAATRVVLTDIPVLGVDRSGSSIALTLAVPQSSALLLQEAQALGGRPYVMLRPLQASATLPTSFSDSDLIALEGR